MIQVCRSISPISKVFQTGTSPVKVLCDDFNEYVCKHSHRTPADILFLEYLAASFGQLWKLKIPEFAFVQIQAEHIPADLTGNTVQPRSFLIPSFGSRNYEFAKEIDASFLSLEANSKELRKIKNKVDILRIGLFDRWIANEDRHIHNYNLLICPSGTGTYFMPIDHEKCFNSNMVNDAISVVQLTDQETLINSDICSLFFKQNPRLASIIESTREYYDVCIPDCRQHLDEILAETPPEWGIDIAAKRILIEKNIFAENWIQETFSNFRETTERFLR